MEDFHLLEQIAVALGLGFIGGLAARLIKLSPIVGYLAAGIFIGPFTPGYEADLETLRELSDIGIIFLMFGVGLHFNLSDLISVRKIVVPGAILQMGLVTFGVMALGVSFGLDMRESAVLGLALSISSTVVVVRTLEERGMLSSVHGRVAVGWLIVQDLATVAFLALLPAMASGSVETFAREATIDIVTATIFLAVMFFIGIRLVPGMLALVARLGSRELFILAVVVSALGVAAGAAFVGLSVALGAFVGGVVVSEKETSHQAAADVLPLREAFAVLFFVAVGMLLDPNIVVDHFGFVVAVVLAVIVGKGLLTVLIALAFPYPARTALITGAGLAQVGEFSFIIAQEGLNTGLLQESTYNVILVAAVISISVNPLTFRGIPAWETFFQRFGKFWVWADRQGPLPEMPLSVRNHVVIAGYGRVGELTGHSLAQLEIPYIVIEADIDRVRRLTNAKVGAIWGDAANVETLKLAGVERCRLVAICVPDESTCLLTTASVRKLNESVPIIVRARHGDEIPILRGLGANHIVVPEYEGGIELMRQSLVALGFDTDQALQYADAIRDIHYGEGHTPL